MSRELSAYGYTVSIEDPGPGAVVGFDGVGTAEIVVQRARTPTDFVSPVAARVG